MVKALIKLAAFGLVVGSTVSGCAYGAIAASGDKVVITRHDSFLFGALRKAFVCKITDGGLSGCAEGESP